MSENDLKSKPAEQVKTPHTLTVEQQKKITMSGVESVNAFSSGQINLSITGGKVTITGSNLKITAFSKASGAFAATGTVYGVRYNTGGGKFSGLFK